MKAWYIRLALFGLLIALAACGGPRSIRLPQGAEAYQLVFAPDGTGLLVLYHVDSYTDAIEYREMPGGRKKWQVENLRGDLSAAFAPDGNEVAVYSENRLLFYDASDGEPGGEIDLEAQLALDYGYPLYGVFHIRYLPDGTLALVTHHRDCFFLETWGRDGTLAREPVLLSCSGNPEWWRPFTSDGGRVAYAKHDTLGIVDVTTGERREWAMGDHLPAYKYISTLAFSPDGDEVAVGLSDTSFLYTDPDPRIREAMMLRFDARTGEVLSRHNAPDDTPVGEALVSLAYSPDGRFLAATTLEANGLFLYDLSSAGKEPEVLCQGKECCRRFPAFAPDGETLATVCGRRVVLWEMKPRFIGGSGCFTSPRATLRQATR